jgi:hypothetical protein
MPAAPAVCQTQLAPARMAGGFEGAALQPGLARVNAPVCRGAGLVRTCCSFRYEYIVSGFRFAPGSMGLAHMAGQTRLRLGFSRGRRIVEEGISHLSKRLRHRCHGLGGSVASGARATSNHSVFRLPGPSMPSRFAVAPCGREH